MMEENNFNQILWSCFFFIFTGSLSLGILSDFEDECHTWERSLFALWPRPVFKIQIKSERFGAMSVHILRQNGKEIYSQFCPVGKAILSYGSAYWTEMNTSFFFLAVSRLRPVLYPKIRVLIIMLFNCGMKEAVRTAPWTKHHNMNIRNLSKHSCKDMNL
jgi:hypothetical protein